LLPWVATHRPSQRSASPHRLAIGSYAANAVFLNVNRPLASLSSTTPSEKPRLEIRDSGTGNRKRRKPNNTVSNHPLIINEEKDGESHNATSGKNIS
jgi:hypothetical protein